MSSLDRRLLAAISAAAAMACVLMVGCEDSKSGEQSADVSHSQPDVTTAPQPDATRDADAAVDSEAPDASAQPPTVTELRYEKIIHHVQGPDNRVEVVWSDDDVLRITRPNFMTHSGTHEIDLHVDLAAEWQLADVLEQLPDDSQGIAERVRRQSEDSLVRLSDPETSVFELVTDEASPRSHRVEATGLQFWAQAQKEGGDLVVLAALEDRIWELMAEALELEQDQ